MKIVILGSCDQALSLGLSCKNIASSITFFDKDIDSLESLRREAERSYEDSLIVRRKFIFSSNLNLDPNQPVVIFDYLSDNDEKLNLLKQINSELQNVSLFITTSKIHSVSKIASLSNDPKAIVGLQYLNSIEKSKVVELVKGIHTSSKVLDKAYRLMEEMGKEIIVVKDSPGFLLNRMTLVLINEAIHLLNEGIASPDEIDKEMELALGLDLGPLRHADNIGLDVILKMLNSLYQGTGNPKYLPCSLLQNMVYSGYLGRKSHSGFYSYSAEILNFPHLNVY